LEYEANQLIAITNAGAWASTFLYDGKLRLRLSRDYEWRSGTWVQTNEVRRVYDGMLLLQVRDQFKVPKLTYTHGPDLSGGVEGVGGIGGLLAVSDLRLAIPEHAHYHADGNGNVTALVDVNQSVVAALRLASDLGPQARVVTLLCDRAERCFSTRLIENSTS
jgi:YD repeat-containing protein